jgi:hypothetical protein
MDLKLTYSGLLPACQGEDKDSDEKQKIRMHFSRQLAKKFEQMPTLVQWSQRDPRAKTTRFNQSLTNATLPRAPSAGGPGIRFACRALLGDAQREIPRRPCGDRHDARLGRGSKSRWPSPP